MSRESTVDWYRLEGGPFSRESFERVWLLALATYGVGDVVTSIGLIWFSPLHVEANPVIAHAIALFGGGGYLALKLLVFVACMGISLRFGYRDGDAVLFYGPPLVLSGIGLLVTASNVWLLL